MCFYKKRLQFLKNRYIVLCNGILLKNKITIKIIHMKSKKRLSLNKFLVCRISANTNIIKGGSEDPEVGSGTTDIITEKTSLLSSIPCWMEDNLT